MMETQFILCDVKKITKSLGTSSGGGARNGQMCGAVSGALMVLGLKFGHFEFENQEQKSKNYGISVEFTNRVKEKCGSIVCKEMLNADLTTEEGKAKIAEKNLFRTLCPKIIADVVEILEEVIAEKSGE